MPVAECRFRRLVALLLLLPAAWLATAAVQPVRAAERIGVVLMHGEQGAPGRIIEGLAQALEKGGYLVGRPDMCWSARRSYEAPFDACLAAIDEAIVRLRNLGATSIAVGGFSLGGAAAIAYGARHSGLLGIFALAPAHDARSAAENAEVADSVARARRLAEDGKGEEQATFADVVFGPSGAYTTEIATTPAIYLSFFGPASPADIPGDARRLTAPLLWVAGAEDPTQRGGPDYGFANAPANPLNRYLSIPSRHQNTPEKAEDAVLAWLAELAASQR
jgi:pimeloyl-ACP methyl ester carboxylesterase